MNEGIRGRNIWDKRVPQINEEEEDRAMNKLLKNKTWYFLTVLFLVMVVGVVESAQANLITYYFTGKITYVPTPPPYGLSIGVGDPVTGTIAYDPSLGYIQSPPSVLSR